MVMRLCPNLYRPASCRNPAPSQPARSPTRRSPNAGSRRWRPHAPGLSPRPAPLCRSHWGSRCRCCSLSAAIWRPRSCESNRHLLAVRDGRRWAQLQHCRPAHLCTPFRRGRCRQRGADFLGAQNPVPSGRFLPRRPRPGSQRLAFDGCRAREARCAGRPGPRDRPAPARPDVAAVGSRRSRLERHRASRRPSGGRLGDGEGEARPRAARAGVRDGGRPRGLAPGSRIGAGPGVYPARSTARTRAPIERLNDGSVARLVGRVGAAAGLERVCRAHGLRHEGITRAIEMGEGLLEVQLAARHADPRTTQRYIDRVKNPQPRISRLISED